MPREITFDSEGIEFNSIEKLRGHKGDLLRLAFLCRTLFWGRVHFYGGRGFRCLTESNVKPALCCQRLGMGDNKFGALVFHYSTDVVGDLFDESKLQGTLKVWLLTERMFLMLRTVSKQWPLLENGPDALQVDVQIRVLENNFKRYSIMPCKNAHWKSNRVWYDRLIAEAAQRSQVVDRMIGKHLTEAEVKDAMGILSPDDAKRMGFADIDLSDSVLLEKKEALVIPVDPTATGPQDHKEFHTNDPDVTDLKEGQSQASDDAEGLLVVN